FGLGRVNIHDGRCEPFLFQGMNIFGDALLGDPKLSANLPLAHALEIHGCHAFAPLEDPKPFSSIPTGHFTNSLLLRLLSRRDSRAGQAAGRPLAFLLFTSPGKMNMAALPSL